MSQVRYKVTLSQEEWGRWKRSRPGDRPSYEYTRQLAHLHLLRELNGLDAGLVFVVLTGDGSPGAPVTRKAWQRALTEIHRALGLIHLRRPERRVEVLLGV